MADKVTFAPISTFTNDTTATTQTNANYVLMQNGLDNTISRDGTQPNQMNANLDMNNNRILNLTAPGSLNEPLRLADVSAFANGTATFNTMPTGGTAGQVLTKNSSSNYDTSWQSDALFSSSTSGDVPASGGGTVNFLRADASWQSPPSPATAPILVTPSGDTSGATDVSNINSALTTASTNGYGLVTLKQGNYYINASINMKVNTHLVGNGAYGTNVDTVINMVSGMNVPGISVFQSNGSMQGWSIEKLAIVTPSTGTSAFGINIDSSQAGTLKDLIVQVNGPSQAGINFNPTQSSGGNGIPANYIHTDRVLIQVTATATSAIGLSLSANNNLGGPGLIGPPTGNTFLDLQISLSLNSQTGIYLGICDTNTFINTLIIGAGSTTPTVINFDYSAHSSAKPQSPSDNCFISSDFGFNINWSNPSILMINTGTPNTSIKSPNTFYNFGYGDGAVAVNLVNVEYFGPHNLLVGGAPARIGYVAGSGAGTSVTQLTSITTGVTANTPCGEITTVSFAWTSGTSQSFVVNNNTVVSTDTIIVNATSASGTFIAAVSGVGAGQFQITLYPLASVTSTVIINFAVMKAVTT